MTKVDMRLADNFDMRRKRFRSGRLYFFLAPILAVIGTALGTLTGGVIGAAGIYLAVGAGFFVSWSTIATVLVAAAVIGLSVWSMTASQRGAGGARGGGGGSQLGGSKAVDQNGQLVNTRQAAKVLPVLYGIARIGCNWVFSRPSSDNNNILNAVVTWSEGEIEGLAQAIDYTPLFTGSGINDIHTGGEFVPTSICACFQPCYGHTDCSCDMTCDATYA